jgi:mono/diheme cytochrome c family protein
MRFNAALVFCLCFIPLDVAAQDKKGDPVKGKAVFIERCATCHGNEGAGDGPVAASLPPEMKPRNLQLGEYKVVKDDASMIDLINKGGAAFGLNPLMPPQPGLSPEDLDNLVAYVRSLKK